MPYIFLLFEKETVQHSLSPHHHLIQDFYSHSEHVKFKSVRVTETVLLRSCP